MKALAKSVMLLALLTICMPAYGQEVGILIYSRTVDCWWAEWAGDWFVDEDHATGFIVLAVGYNPETGEVLGILDVEQIRYWKDGRTKLYWQYEEEYFIERVELNGEVIWVIEWVHAEEVDQAQIFMIRGKPRQMNIGLGRDEKREVVRTLKGYYLLLYWMGEEVEKEMCTVTWRLQQQWTRWANDEDRCDGDWECAIYDIVKDWLERRGYDEVS